MENRLRWMQGATALLYLGPLLAGLGGFGWAVVPVFAAIFLLWLFILRPQQWPRRWADWRQADALVRLATQAVVQLLLVLVFFGVGRGMGGVLGALPPFPLMLPIAVSFLSIPLCRMIWDPWKMAEMDRFLDDALAQVNGVGAGAVDDTERARAGAMLAALPTDLPPEEVLRHLRAMEETVSADVLRDALMYAAGAGETRHLRSLVIFGTDGRLAEVVGRDLPTEVFHCLPDDPALMALYARRACDVLREDSGLFGDFPTRDLLQARKARLEGTEAAAALAELLALYDQIDEDGAAA